jgi:eukaryotic-like serine/threonine-protein kinase
VWSDALTPKPDGGSGEEGASEIPRHLGRYRIVDVLGAGGMGVVLAAHDPELDRVVAIKLLRRGDAAAQERLLAEAQAMAKLRHPNVVAVYDVVVDFGRVFVAMERVAGETLRAWLATRRPWRSIVAHFVAAGRGLAAAHAAGIVHRDVKPENVLVGDDGSVRVADFLVSVAQDGPDEIAGTPAYMAPEQHGGEPVGPAADQFAFAVALWEALSGARPFAGSTSTELRDAKLRTPAEPAAAGAPRWVFALLRRALAPAPDERHSSMDVLIAALERGLRRRRRIAIGAASLAIIAGTAAVSVALVGDPPRGPDCRLAGAEVERIWNPATRDALTAAFAASSRPHARETSTRVAAALDRHAAALAAARSEACTAHQRGTLSADGVDRRMACLDRRITEMAALTDLLAHRADDLVIDRAFEAASGLAGAAVCTASDGRPPPPPAVRDRVTAAERRLADASALRMAGRLPDARTALDQLATEARELAYAPLLAEVLHQRARVVGSLEPAAGQAAFEEAARAAADAGDDRLVADAWIGLLVVLDAGQQPQQAFDRLVFADVAAARSGDPAQREQFLYIRGAVQLTLGKLAEARADLEAARASLTARGAGETLAAGRYALELGIVMYALGDYEQSLALNREAVAIFERVLGPEHLMVAKAQVNLAKLVAATGDAAEAHPLFVRALAIIEGALGPDDLTVALVRSNLAESSQNLGRIEEAVAYAERALEVREKKLGGEHPLVAESVQVLAALRRVTGRYDEALALYRRGLAIREAVYGPDHADVAVSLQGISQTLLELGRAGEALAPAMRARDILTRVVGPESAAAGEGWSYVAEAYAAQHRDREECHARARALTIIEASLGPESPELIDPLLGQAECLLRQGKPDEARRLAERKLAIVAKSGRPPYYAGQAYFVIARALWADPATRAGARDAVARATAAYADAPPYLASEREKLDRWAASHR